MCGKVKCVNCDVKLPKCELINGMCPSCYEISLQKQQDANATNNDSISE